MKSFIATTFAITTMAIKLENAGAIGTNTCGLDGKSACTGLPPAGAIDPHNCGTDAKSSCAGPAIDPFTCGQDAKSSCAGPAIDPHNCGTDGKSACTGNMPNMPMDMTHLPTGPYVGRCVAGPQAIVSSEIEGAARKFSLMTFKRNEALTNAHVPNFSSAIERSSHQFISVSVEMETHNLSLVSF